MKAHSMSGFRSAGDVFSRLGVVIAAVRVVMTSMAEKGSSDPPTEYALASPFFLFQQMYCNVCIVFFCVCCSTIVNHFDPIKLGI